MGHISDDLPVRITQLDLEHLMILENSTHPWLSKIIRAVQNGAEIDPGPLTIQKPVFDDGPLVILRSTRDPLAITRRILESHRALLRAIDQGQYLEGLSPEVLADLRLSARTEFERASQRLIANAWALWRQKCDIAQVQRDWARFPDLLRQWSRIKQMAFLLAAGSYALRFGFAAIARRSVRSAMINTHVLGRA